MTKEYIGEAFRAPYCEALVKQGAVVEWEVFIHNQWIVGKGLPSFGDYITFRFKSAAKRMVTMYDAQRQPHQLVAPEQDTPNDVCFYIDAQDLVGGFNPSLPSLTQRWLGLLLETGNIFLTREDAQAMADFQRKQRLGEV